MKERVICPDCLSPIVEDRMATFTLGTRCKCPEKHWAEQDRQALAALAAARKETSR